jgi:hypothetical protein
MNKLVLIIVVVIIGLFFSCKPVIEVVPMSDTAYQINENGIVYHLPRTVFHVEVIVKHQLVVPGPYHKFANKYLSITDVPFQEEELYFMDEIKFNPITEPDPDAAYLVLSNSQFPSFTFTPENILCGVNLDSNDLCQHLDIETSRTTKLNQEFPESPFFTDLSVKRNFIDMLDTTYKVVEIDSVFQKIPVYNTVISSKDTEQKAEEAANFIIKLRKRRFKLEAGMNDNLAKGNALSQMIDELNKLEQEYLSLFIGKKFVEQTNYSVYYIPEMQVEDKNIVLFWFSEEDGFSATETANSRPIQIKFKTLPQTKNVSKFYARQTEFEPKSQGFYYRIPGKCRLTIFDGNNIMSDEIFDVAQMGILNSLPASMFKKKVPEILFDVHSGSIIYIR